MLKNEPTLAIVAVHTAENEPLKILGVIHFNFQFGPYSVASSCMSRIRGDAIVNGKAKACLPPWRLDTDQS